jgi:hypothetical protein
MIELDIVQFRTNYPQFSDVGSFPDMTIENFWNMATCSVSSKNYGYLSGNCRQMAINLMAAHLLALSLIQNQGKVTGLMQSATISMVSISLTPPPTPNQWQWWLNQTSYGQQLLALLQSASVGGMSIGGSPERYGFRQFAGRFG